eukprot:TRINITY_DN1579_c0_g1_i1.p2 TRINITY_DN1579_c0_g1~~TRINITY_DN1579_c0_g1_i1.p2  ORF type:complete len:145 (+),score=35.95 TRINITY_DN1579_c0_g1_i1:816-1250(+)
MTEEIDDIEDELQTLLDEINKGWKKLNSIEDIDDQIRHVRGLQERVKRADEVMSSYVTEFRELPPSVRTTYQQSKDKYQDQIQTLKNQISAERTKLEKEKLANSGQKEADEDELLRQGASIQRQDLSILDRMIGRIDETEKVFF